tara:strand:- start:17229 stop:17402 length:174 start_codon:yes stop_codon:yes gene_type:complete
LAVSVQHCSAIIERSGSFGQFQNEKRHVREILARAFFDDSLHRLEFALLAYPKRCPD